jgi:hypothetical protein
MLCSLLSLIHGTDAFALGKKQKKDPTSPPAPPAASMSHIEYFGYYASAMSGVGTGNYIQETSSHSNLVWIREFCGQSEVSKLQQARARGMKAVLDVGCNFFDFRTLKLLPEKEIERRLAGLIPRIQPYLDTIAAFYPLDEPFHIGKKKGISYGYMGEQLRTVNRVLKSLFPTIPIAVIITTEAINSPEVRVPENYDWVGFDCYGSWVQCQESGSIPSLYARMLAKLKPHQKTMVIADANIREHAGSEEQRQLANRAGLYFNLAASDPRVIAFIPFIYQSFDEGSRHYVGVRDMPRVLPTYISIGRSIIK